jgi:hypothetical protein
MEDSYVYGHVKKWEAEKFEKYTVIERQIQYIRVIIKRRPKLGVKRLSNILDWKFGKCILKATTIKELGGK